MNTLKRCLSIINSEDSVPPLGSVPPEDSFPPPDSVPLEDSVPPKDSFHYPSDPTIMELFRESRDQAGLASECNQRGDLYIGAYLEEFRRQVKTFKVEWKCVEAEAVTLTGDPLYLELWVIIREPFIPEDEVVGTQYFIARIYKENDELRMELSVYHIDLFTRLRIPTLKSSLHIGGYCDAVKYNWSGCYSTKLFHNPLRCKACRDHAKFVSEHVSRCAECKTFDHFAVNKCSNSAHRNQWAFPNRKDIALQIECVNCWECTAYRRFLYVSEELEVEISLDKKRCMDDPNSESYFSDDPGSDESDVDSDPESDSDNSDHKSQRNIDRLEEKLDRV